MPREPRGDITLLYRADKSNAVSFALYPLIVSPDVKDFDITSHLSWVLEKDKNRFLWVVGWFTEDPTEDDKRLVEQLRKKYDVLAYFDLGDGTEIQQAALMPWFDLWYKKQLLRDRAQYLRPLRGNRYFTGYYMERFGVRDDPEMPSMAPVAAGDLAKLRLGWNILLGAYPISTLAKRAAAVAAITLGIGAARLIVRRSRWGQIPRPSSEVCHARFGWGEYRPTVGYQRKVFLEKLSRAPGFLVGRVGAAQYARELKEVRGILSPFGWGEVCFRDSEAIRHGAVLFKPDTGHLETWPDAYQAYKTYIPLAWDASDAEILVKEVLADEARCLSLTETAWAVLAQAENDLPERVRSIAREIRMFQK